MLRVYAMEMLPLLQKSWNVSSDDLTLILMDATNTFLYKKMDHTKWDRKGRDPQVDQAKEIVKNPK